MVGIIDYLSMCRANQWYKNLVIFLTVIFVNWSALTGKIPLLLLGFASLSLVSSSNYIINDLVDLKNDKHHPEKKSRSIASGKVKPTYAGIIAAVLAIAASSIAYSISLNFLYCVLLLFAITQIYSFLLKHEVFVDILLISSNFVIRAASGAIILGVFISPWLILCTFFLAMFLSVGKRHADLV